MMIGIMDIIRLQDQFYILATSSRIDDRTRVLKHGDTFAVFDRFGDMRPSEWGSWVSITRSAWRGVSNGRISIADGGFGHSRRDDCRSSSAGSSAARVPERRPIP